MCLPHSAPATKLAFHSSSAAAVFVLHLQVELLLQGEDPYAAMATAQEEVPAGL